MTQQTDELLRQLRLNYLDKQVPALGFGQRPALLIVDFIEGFTNPASPFAGPWDVAIEHTAELLVLAHTRNVPALFTTVEFDASDLEDNLLIRKAPRVAALTRGSEWTRVDQRLPRHPSDVVISKKHGSAFFGTDLAARLSAIRIDTLLIAGCVTSGCVRASAVDASQYGFRPLVVREAVGDRSLLANETNLLDIEARYGDVVSRDRASEYLTALPHRERSDRLSSRT
jgi:nicotinamidase-related amidase